MHAVVEDWLRAKKKRGGGGKKKKGKVNGQDGVHLEGKESFILRVGAQPSSADRISSVSPQQSHDRIEEGAHVSILREGLRRLLSTISLITDLARPPARPLAALGSSSIAAMSLPRRAYDPRRVCLLPLPSLPSFLSTNKRTLGIYTAGALFAIGWWFFLDACIISSLASRHPDPEAPFDPPPVSVTFADWVPGLCGTLGMVIVNLIDKQHLTESGGAFSFGGGSGGGWGGDNVQWRARLFLFVGFALMAGGLAGSIVSMLCAFALHRSPRFPSLRSKRRIVCSAKSSTQLCYFAPAHIRQGWCLIL